MMGISGAVSVDRALALLRHVLADGGGSTLPALARGMGLPVATAYRLAASLVNKRYLIPAGNGRYFAGPAMTGTYSLRPALVAVGRPIVKALARATGCTAHLGVLDDDMVTYLIKAGRKNPFVFTEEGKQLEAYCSGIGKVLLAALSEAELDAYLAGGPFVALTENTTTDPKDIAAEIEQVREQALARDEEEIAIGLQCLAVGVEGPDKQAIAALSISRRVGQPGATEDEERDHLHAASAAISAKLWGSSVSRNGIQKQP
jgi:IclR family transcriptional regulator, acetate operon repressor